MLTILQADPPRSPSYAAGNILNLLLFLDIDLRGYDFANLAVWQAYLDRSHVAEVNFAGADLSGTIFLDVFRPVHAVAFPPNGEWVAAGMADGQIRIWQVKDGQLLLTLEGHDRVVRCVAFSPDGCTLASGGDDRTARLWDVPSGREIKVLSVSTGIVRSVAFSSDGRTVAFGSIDCTVRLWDVETGQPLVTLKAFVTS